MAIPTFLLGYEGRHEAQKVLDGNGSGALPELISRSLGFECRFSPLPIKAFKMQKGKFHGMNMLARKAVGMALMAQHSGLAGAIVVVDRDDDSKEDRVADFRQAQQRADDQLLPAAFGVAIREFDAWMIADVAALRGVLGDHVATQSDPEADGDPKKTFGGLRSPSEDRPTHQLYTAIVRGLRIDELRVRCPIGFGEFHDRLSRLSKAL